MTPGTVVHHKKFKFEDGGESKKLMIILGGGGKKPLLFVLTTSQQHRRLSKEGCNPDEGYYFLPTGRDWFDRPTWVLIHNPMTLDPASIVKDNTLGLANIVHTMKGDTLRAIINCLQKSEDVSEYHLSLLN